VAVVAVANQTEARLEPVAVALAESTMGTAAMERQTLAVAEVALPVAVLGLVLAEVVLSFFP